MTQQPHDQRLVWIIENTSQVRIRDLAMDILNHPKTSEVDAMGAAEPVAWRVRVISDDQEEWALLPAGGGADYLDRKGYECQPLYTAPAPTTGDDHAD